MKAKLLLLLLLASPFALAEKKPVRQEIRRTKEYLFPSDSPFKRERQWKKEKRRQQREARKKPVIRRQRITNDSAFLIKVGLTQEGKNCKKRKEWAIQPGKSLKIFMVEFCSPIALEIWAPNQPEIKFTAQGTTGKAPLVFSTQTELDSPKKMQKKAKTDLTAPPLPEEKYVYWNIAIKGKRSPLQVMSSNYTYRPRKIVAGKIAAKSGLIVGQVAAGALDVAAGIVTFGIYNGLSYDFTERGLFFSRVVLEPLHEKIGPIR